MFFSNDHWHFSCSVTRFWFIYSDWNLCYWIWGIFLFLFFAFFTPLYKLLKLLSIPSYLHLMAIHILLRNRNNKIIFLLFHIKLPCKYALCTHMPSLFSSHNGRTLCSLWGQLLSLFPWSCWLFCLFKDIPWVIILPLSCTINFCVC
jgi:hypothetical protein